MVVLAVLCPVCGTPMEWKQLPGKRKHGWVCPSCSSVRKRPMTIAEGFAGAAASVSTQRPTILVSAKPRNRAKQPQVILWNRKESG